MNRTSKTTNKNYPPHSEYNKNINVENEELGTSTYINYNPSRHVAGAVVAAVAAAGLLDDVAPGEDCFYGEDAKNLPARVAVVVAVEAVADVLPPGMAMTGTAVTDGNGVDGSAAGAGGVAVGPRLGPVDAGIPVDWVPVAEYCAKKKSHSAPGVRDDTTQSGARAKGALMIAKAPPIYLRCTRHGEKKEHVASLLSFLPYTFFCATRDA